MLFVLVSVLLCGCNSFQVEGMSPASGRDHHLAIKEPPKVKADNNTIVPIQINDTQFQSVVDWFDHEHVLYVVNDELGAKIYKHHLFTGTSELFFETTDPIITLQSNPSSQHFLIHTSNSNTEANLIVVDEKGNALFDWEVKSAELQFVWNPFDENNLFITSFLEDWSFTNYILNVEQKEVKENSLPHPFIQWMSPSKIAYLKWEDGFTEAPLYSASVQGIAEKKLADNIFAYHTYEDLLLTISASTNLSVYQFYEVSTMKKINEFSLPVINTYSDNWWVPNFDYDPNTKNFYYYKPVEEQLNLVSFSIETGEEETILTNIEDQPINLSSDGERLLLGYQYNTIIEIEDKKTSELIQ